MAVVGIRQLSRETSRVIQEFEETNEPVIITREGRPIGALMPVSQRQMEDLVLATAPEFRESHAKAQEDVATGRARSIEDIARERGVELPPRGEPAAGEGEGEGVEISVEPLRRATEVEFSSLSKVLSPVLAGRILSEANEDIGSLSGEVLGAIAASEQGNPADEEVREVTELTAALYSRLFRRRLLDAIGSAEVEEAIAESRRSVGRRMRVLNQAIVEPGDVSFDQYAASLRGVKLAWETAEGEGDDAPAPVADEYLAES